MLGDVSERRRQAAGRLVRLTQRNELHVGGHTHRASDRPCLPRFEDYPLTQPSVRPDGGKPAGQQPDKQAEKGLRGG